MLTLSCGTRQAEPKSKDTVSGSAQLDKDSVSIALAGRDSVDVLALLREKHQVAAKATLAGTFVEGIDEVHNGARAYWVYTVNDSSPEVACDKYLTRNGDRVVWHFRKL
jgi:hypothetical protein